MEGGIVFALQKNACRTVGTDAAIKPLIDLGDSLGLGFKDIVRADLQKIFEETKVAADTFLDAEQVEATTIVPNFLHQMQQVLSPGHIDEIHALGNDEQVFLFR